jgi:hypothetical protein
MQRRSGIKLLAVLVALAAIGVGVAVNAKDIARYVKMRRM